MLRVRIELKTKLHRASFSSGLENHSHVRPHDCQEIPAWQIPGWQLFYGLFPSQYQGEVLEST